MSEDEAKASALWTAASKGDVDAVKALIAEKINVDVRGHDGRTALMNAAGCRRIEVARLLLQANADVNLESYGGDTAVSYVVKTDWAGLFHDKGDDTLGMIKLLVSSGADIHEWALGFAIDSCSLAVVKAMLKADNLKKDRNIAKAGLEFSLKMVESDGKPEEILGNQREVRGFCEG